LLEEVKIGLRKASVQDSEIVRSIHRLIASFDNSTLAGEPVDAPHCIASALAHSLGFVHLFGAAKAESIMRTKKYSFKQ
jgi:hypothetical protein